MTKIALISTGAHTSWCSRRLLLPLYSCDSGTCVITSKPQFHFIWEHDGRFSFQHVCKKRKKKGYFSYLINKWLDYKVTNQ
jgi:hypothetical protein